MKSLLGKTKHLGCCPQAFINIMSVLMALSRINPIHVCVCVYFFVFDPVFVDLDAQHLMHSE